MEVRAVKNKWQVKIMASKKSGKKIVTKAKKAAEEKVKARKKPETKAAVKTAAEGKAGAKKPEVKAAARHEKADAMHTAAAGKLEAKDGKPAVAKEATSAAEEIAKKMQMTGELALFEVIEYPLVSEKAVGMIEKENKLCFVVNKKATKTDVKKAVETLYNVKVDSVNMMRDMKARKRAFVRINEKFKAEDLATKLGVL